MDDIILFDPNLPFLSKLKQHLSIDFKNKDMGDTKFRSGLEIQYTTKDIELFQTTTFRKSLKNLVT